MNTSVLQQSIHKYCETIMQVGDFNKQQTIIEQLKQFILDWNNLPIFRSIIEQDGDYKTTFVLYELMYKSLAGGGTFTNVLPEQIQTISIEDYENDQKKKATEVVIQHLDIATNYLRKYVNIQPTYVINTVLFSIAYLLRKYWGDIANIESLMDKLINTYLNNPDNNIQLTVGCKLFENLLNCVRQYNYASGYLEFRKVMLGFQRSSLFKVLAATHSIIQKKLANNLSFYQLWLQDKLLCSSLIQLLNQLINFNFNLSFYELDMDTDLKENNVVNFPECYIQIVQDYNLLKLLFQGSVEFFRDNQDLANLFIVMLQKIGSVRQSLFLGKRCKKLVRAALWQGLSYLLSHQDVYIKNSDFVTEINSLVIRVVNNFTFRKVQKFKDIYESVVQQLVRLFQSILQINGFQIHLSNVTIKAQEVWNQMIYQYTLQKPGNDQDINYLRNCSNQNLRLVLNSILKTNIFRELNESLTVKKLKKCLEINFSPFQTIFSRYQIDYLNLIGDYLMQLPIQNYQQLNTDDQQLLLIKISSILCIVSTFVLFVGSSELNVGFDCYQFPSREERNSNVITNKVVTILIDIIKYSNTLNIGCINPAEKIFHMTSMIFIENFLLLTIEGLVYDENQQIVKSSSNFYTALIRDQVIPENYIATIQPLLEKCFQIFTISDLQLVEQSLKLVELIYSKIKRQIIRKVFRSLPITVMLKQFLQQLNLTCFDQVQYIKKRQLVFKIISIVWIDDTQDDYISSMVEIYKQIKSSIMYETSKINMLKYIWDLIGVTNEIDIDSIYRNFLRIVSPDIHTLLQKDNVLVFANDYDSSLGLIDLLNSIFYNKNTRLQNENIQLVLYQIYAKAINFFQIMCEHQLQITQQNINQNILKQTAKLIKVMGLIIGSKQINQGFFIIYNDSQYLDLFGKQLLLIEKYRPYFNDYPKYKRYLYESLETLCAENSETLAYRCSTEHYIQIYTICRDTFSDILLCTKVKGEEQINQDSLIMNTLSGILCNINQFLIQEGLVGDQADIQLIQSKIKDIQQKGKQIYTQIFEQGFQVLFTNLKTNKVSQSIPDLLFAISLLNPKEFQTHLIQMIQQLAQSLRIDENLLQNIAEAYKYIQGQIHPQAKDQFQKQIKSLFDKISSSK